MNELGTWKFDDTVAQRFRNEALANIPDYQKVISLTLDILEKAGCRTDIIDVGSALGETVNALIKSGFKNVWGVEDSVPMCNESMHQSQIIVSDSIPVLHKWNAVVLNWTLHFIKNRKEYLASVFDGLNQNGILILTDKMDCLPLENEQYIQFKKDNGMSTSQIEAKNAAITGVLTTLPLEWYIDTLTEIGFVDIEIVNTRFMFNTLVCRK